MSLLKQANEMIKGYGGWCYVLPGESIDKLRVTIDRTRPAKLVKVQPGETDDSVLRRIAELFEE